MEKLAGCCSTWAQFQPPAENLASQLFKKKDDERQEKRIQQRRQVHLKGLVQLKKQEERKKEKQADEVGVTLPRGQRDRLEGAGLRRGSDTSAQMDLITVGPTNRSNTQT